MSLFYYKCSTTAILTDITSLYYSTTLLLYYSTTLLRPSTILLYYFTEQVQYISTVYNVSRAKFSNLLSIFVRCMF